jgi:hypothetical protein
VWTEPHSLLILGCLHFLRMSHLKLSFEHESEKDKGVQKIFFEKKSYSNKNYMIAVYTIYTISLRLSKK